MNDIYAVASERDHSNIWRSRGPIILETYMSNASLLNAIMRVQKINGEYGKCKIFSLEEVSQEEIESFVSHKPEEKRKKLLSLLGFEPEPEHVECLKPEVDIEIEPVKPQPGKREPQLELSRERELEEALKECTEALYEVFRLTQLNKMPAKLADAIQRAQAVMCAQPRH